MCYWRLAAGDWLLAAGEIHFNLSLPHPWPMLFAQCPLLIALCPKRHASLPGLVCSNGHHVNDIAYRTTPGKIVNRGSHSLKDWSNRFGTS